MNVKRLDISHASAYRALMLQAYALHPDAFTSSVAERAVLPLSWWESRVASQATGIVLGAFHGEELVGVVGVSFHPREKVRHKATLFGMFIRPEARGNGSGAALVEAALAEARSRGEVKVMQLTVTQGNRAAQGIYSKFGFREFGVEPFAVAVGREFVAKVHMWRSIKAGCD